MLALLAFGAVAVIAAWAVAEGLTPLDSSGARTAGAAWVGAVAAGLVGLALVRSVAAVSVVLGDGWRAGVLGGSVVAAAAWYVARRLSQRGWTL